MASSVKGKDTIYINPGRSRGKDRVKKRFGRERKYTIFDVGQQKIFSIEQHRDSTKKKN